jgi:hypothetical protein
VSTIVPSRSTMAAAMRERSKLIGIQTSKKAP